jgi:hypothetical protein
LDFGGVEDDPQSQSWLPQSLIQVMLRFHALARLIEQTDCCRLRLGNDVLKLSWLVTPLLEKEQVRREH